MLYVEIKKKEGSWGRVVVFKCEQCEKLFEVAYHKKRTTIEGSCRFCSRTCKHLACCKGGILQKEFEQKYGVSNVFARDDVKKKIQDTMIDRHIR